jgi:Flp pilus assembly protein TadD
VSILDHGIEAGLEAFAELPQSIHDSLIESTIHVLGVRLLGQRRVAEAVQLFEFNTRAFPKSAKRWESLGAAHLRAGNRQRAIESYRRALELHPASTSIQQVLEKLEGQ